MYVHFMCVYIIRVDFDIVIVNIDVKRWLAELRGKDMPESFSWSYKRFVKWEFSYIENNYILINNGFLDLSQN